MRVLLLLFSFLSLFSQAQQIDSKTIIRASWDSTWYEFVSGKTLLTLNQNTGDLLININLDPIHSDIDTLEKLLHKEIENTITFSGNVGMPVSTLYQQANKEISYKMIGNLELNKVARSIRSSFSPVIKNTWSPEPSANSTQSPLYLTIKMDFDPKEFHLEQYYDKLPSVIQIEIVQGYLNKSY